MKLASLKEGGRDGTLIVVDRELKRAVRATNIALERQNVDLASLIEQAVRIFTPQAKEKDISIAAVLPGVSLTIVGAADEEKNGDCPERQPETGRHH